MEKDKPEELGEIKYSGLMPDGTRYDITLNLKDGMKHEQVSKALELEAAGHAVNRGLDGIIKELCFLYWNIWDDARKD